MEIVKVRGGDYDRYEELVLRRDQLRREAGEYQVRFVARFGAQMVRGFERRIACIRKKKLIGYYQQAINRGEAIDQERIDALLQEEMAEYERQLKEKMAAAKAAGKAKAIPELEALRVRRLYRQIARKIHPDSHPQTAQLPQLLELWNRAVLEYRCNNLAGLEETAVLVDRALAQLGLGSLRIEVPDIATRIRGLEEEIRQIVATDPYRYGELLDDPDAVREKERELSEQEETYQKYEQELDKVIEEILKSGVSIVWRITN